MNQVKQVISQIATHKKTPLVLTLVSCAGVVATGVLAAQASPKAVRILDQLRQDEYFDGLDYEPIPPLEVVKHTWPVFIPAISVGLATIGTVVTMNRITDRNIALLTAGATLATNTLRDYQQHVLEEIGAEKDSRIRDRVAKNAIAHAPVPESDQGFIYTDGDVLCYDSLSGRYFRHNLEKIRAVENDLNRELLTEMTLPLNSLYDALGLETVDVGEILGWNIDNMVNLHFSSQLSPDKKPALVIGFINMPTADYTTHIR